MNVLKNFIKRTPLFPLVRRIYQRLGAILFPDEFSDFPSVPYRFNKKEAKRIYNIVLSGKLHHRVGYEVSHLEQEFAQYHRVKYALATNAGTAALEMAVKAVGIQPGDEVIVPSYTFIATAQAVLLRGGIPVFADIDDTFTISPKSIAEKITSRTRAIIPVHVFGNVANMEAINKIARQHNLSVIEDCCQAIGALYKGKKVGSLSDVACFSFNEKKAVTAGQGGMIITNNKKLFDIANHTRETGQLDDSLASDVVTTGNTYALTEMQGALARMELARLDELNAIRRENFSYFIETIDTAGLPLRWYRLLPEAYPSFSRLALLVDFQKLSTSRASFLRAMRARDIPMKTFYPKPLYSYSLFQNRKDGLLGTAYPFSLNRSIVYRGLHLPYVEKFCRQLVGIEFSPYITKRHLRYFCGTVTQYLRSYL